MPDFIEVTTRMGETVCINVSRIETIAHVVSSSDHKTRICLIQDEGVFYIQEEYSDVVRNLRRAICLKN